METPVSETANANGSNHTTGSRNSLSGMALMMNPTNPNAFLQVPYAMQQPSPAMFATPMHNINNSGISPMLMTTVGSGQLPPRRVTLHLGWTSGSSSSSGQTKKIRKVIRDSRVSVQDWLYDIMTNEVQYYHLQALVDSLEGAKSGTSVSSLKLSLGPQRSMVMDMNNIEISGKKRKRTYEGIIACIRMELVTYSSDIVLSPRDSLYDLLESGDENLELRAAGEGNWSTNEACVSTNTTNPTSKKAKKRLKNGVVDTTKAKAKKSNEVKEGKWSTNESGVSINTTPPPTKKSKKGFEKGTIDITQAKGKESKVVEEDSWRANEGVASINTANPATKRVEKEPERDMVDAAKVKTNKKGHGTMKTASAENKQETSQSKRQVSATKEEGKPVENGAKATKEPNPRKLSEGSVSDVRGKKKKDDDEIESQSYLKEETKDSKDDDLAPLDLGEWDVLTGSKKDRQSIGNKKYEDYIENHFRDYRDEKQEGKKDITQTIMTKFTFYRMDKKSDEWKHVEVGESLRNKVQKDLRNRIKRENVQAQNEGGTADNHSRLKDGDTEEENAEVDNDMVQKKSKKPDTKSSHDSVHEVGDKQDEKDGMEGIKEGETRSEAASSISKENANANNGNELNGEKKESLDQAHASKDEVEENDTMRKTASSSDESSSSTGSSSSSSTSSSTGSDSDSSDGSSSVVSDTSRAGNASSKVNAPPKIIKSTPQTKLAATVKMPKETAVTPLSSPKAKAPLTSTISKSEKTSSSQRKKPLLDPKKKFKFPDSKRRMSSSSKKNESCDKTSTSQAKSKSPKLSKESMSTKVSKT